MPSLREAAVPHLAEQLQSLNHLVALPVAISYEHMLNLSCSSLSSGADWLGLWLHILTLTFQPCLLGGALCAVHVLCEK